MPNKSKVIKAEQYNWQDVEKKIYKTDTQNFKDIHRFTLLGDDIPELNFQTRYFEIQPGGYSSLEQHRHPHSVIVIRGSGSLVLGNEIFELGMHDVVYISPETIHQFHADEMNRLDLSASLTATETGRQSQAMKPFNRKSHPKKF